MESKCIMCGEKAVQFRWTNLFLNRNSLIEVDFSSYCLRCGDQRRRTLRKIHKENNKSTSVLLPEEKIYD